MKTMRTPLRVGLMGSVTLAILSACAVTGVGVDGSVGVGVDYGYPGAYYEPYGYDYGGWGGGYWVGPSRGGHRDDHGDGRRDVGGRGGHAPAYRPAPRGRSAPSIPGRSRGH
ncbi:MAG TPA: hypothetical protein VK794_05145 [Steroidobacteraceae bacterium]|jgi:hypothetical protein|nr:hypothetical protein [Steroidobacteraceae bacterium]